MTTTNTCSATLQVRDVVRDPSYLRAVLVHLDAEPTEADLQSIRSRLLTTAIGENAAACSGARTRKAEAIRLQARLALTAYPDTALRQLADAIKDEVLATHQAQVAVAAENAAILGFIESHPEWLRPARPGAKRLAWVCADPGLTYEPESFPTAREAVIDAMGRQA